MCHFDAKILAQLDVGTPVRAPRGAQLRLVRSILQVLVAGLLGVLAVSVVGCESAPEADEAPHGDSASSQDAPNPPRDPAAFSGALAFEHLRELAAIGPRQSGTRGAARARRVLERELTAAGAKVEELQVRVPVPGAAGAEPAFEEAVHLVAVLPGESSDRFLLAAAYDTRDIPGKDFAGANASASGPALLVELTRALLHRSRPYTIVVVMLDADRLPALHPGVGFPGARAFAAHLREGSAGFDDIRLAVVFQQVGDLDLSIARDLRSHHVYREFFWEAAGVLGQGAYFAPDAGVESVEGSHLELIEAGLPRTVLIADPRYGGPDMPGRYAASEQDTALRCSPHSLEVVGSVTLEALDRIATRLARIDRFRASPLEDPHAVRPGDQPD